MFSALDLAFIRASGADHISYRTATRLQYHISTENLYDPIATIAVTAANAKPTEIL